MSNVPIEALEELADEWEERASSYTLMRDGVEYKTCAEELRETIEEHKDE